MTRLDTEERFWQRVEKTEACWLWRGSGKGYGEFRPTPSHRILAHRFSYQLLVGPIPQGLVIDHLCRVPRCVNPAHLEPVTHKVNILRGVGHTAVNAAKTHCPRGHEYTPENTVYERGSRICHVCKLAKLKRQRHQRIAKTAAIAEAGVSQ